MRDRIKEQLINLFSRPDWETEIETFYSSMRGEVIWVMVDFVKENKYVEESLKIAKIFINDSDPKPNDPINLEVLAGEDTVAIGTVRGTLCWLIGALIGTLKTEYYPEVIDLLEKLAGDEVAYVRLQATYPLANLIVNVKATKNKDETIFDFKDEDRKRTIDLAFKMLSENREYPRVLEGVANVFDKMRFLDEKEAGVALNSLLYDAEGELQSDSVTHMVAPLLIFFAEFSNYPGHSFQNEKFQKLLEKIITISSPRLKTDIVWHFWKTIESSPETYSKLKPYIPLFFQGKFQEPPLSQYEFLIQKILPISPSDAIDTFELEINYLKRFLSEIPVEPGGRIWFFNIENVLEKTAEIKPSILPNILYVLKELYLKRGWIGDVKQLFTVYEKAPKELQGELKPEIDLLYQQLQSKFPELQ